MNEDGRGFSPLMSQLAVGVPSPVIRRRDRRPPRAGAAAAGAFRGRAAGAGPAGPGRTSRLFPGAAAAGTGFLAGGMDARPAVRAGAAAGRADELFDLPTPALRLASGRGRLAGLEGAFETEGRLAVLREVATFFRTTPLPARLGLLGAGLLTRFLAALPEPFRTDKARRATAFLVEDARPFDFFPFTAGIGAVSNDRILVAGRAPLKKECGNIPTARESR